MLVGSQNSYISFTETTQEPLHLYKQSLVQYKIMDITTGFIWIIILLDKALSMVMVWNFAVMLGQTLNHSVYNSVLLCNVISL
jgi:hypothetical protein